MDAIAILNDHTASITDRVEEEASGPFDDMGDYVGDTRECACGVVVEGFYEYHSHLVAMLGGVSLLGSDEAKPFPPRENLVPVYTDPVIGDLYPQCPKCGAEVQQWADDGEADLADYWECGVCGAHGVFPDPTDPTKTVNGITIKGVTA